MSGDHNEGVHLFPFRTQKLSPLVPMVLFLSGDGRVGSCRAFFISSHIYLYPYPGKVNIGTVEKDPNFLSY